MKFFKDFFLLIYPDICMACGNPLYRHEKCICSLCLHHLPQTDFHLNKDNPVSRMFWGRVNLESATSFLYYNKGGKVQQLIHQLKYKNQKQLGIYMGALYGKILKNSGFFDNLDTVVPVPLHPKKKRQRGYNQSDLIAEGMAGAMKVNVDKNTLFRSISSQTQTKKSRYSRYQNVSTVFNIKNNHLLGGKHILLVDDVITTGSTIESCVNALQQIPGLKVSVASIAVAN